MNRTQLDRAVKVIRRGQGTTWATGDELAQVLRYAERRRYTRVALRIRADRRARGR